jgi:predicted Fe-Mo cluster-binding NifX family protein
MKIAVPVDYGRVSSHFGRATHFVIVHVENQQTKKREFLEPPRQCITRFVLENCWFLGQDRER